MKRVFSSWNLAAAHHARNLLEAGGIRSIVRNEILSSAIGELPPAECQVEVWVLRRDEAQRAESLLRESFAPPLREPWTCGCGELGEGQFTHCWRCGAERR